MIYASSLSETPKTWYKTGFMNYQWYRLVWPLQTEEHLFEPVLHVPKLFDTITPVQCYQFTGFPVGSRHTNVTSLDDWNINRLLLRDSGNQLALCQSVYTFSSSFSSLIRFHFKRKNKYHSRNTCMWWDHENLNNSRGLFWEKNVCNAFRMFPSFSFNMCLHYTSTVVHL